MLFYSYLPDFDHTEQVVWQPEPEVPKPWYREHWRELTLGVIVLLLLAR